MRNSVFSKRASDMQQSAPSASLMDGLGQWSYAALQVWLAGWMQPDVLREQAARRLQSLFIRNVVIKIDAGTPQRSSTSGKLRRVVYAPNRRPESTWPAR